MAAPENPKYFVVTYTENSDYPTDFNKGQGDYYIHEFPEDSPLLALVARSTTNLDLILSQKVEELNAETALGHDPYPELPSENGVGVTYLVFIGGKYYMPLYGKSSVEDLVEVTVDQSIVTVSDKKEFLFVNDAKFKNVASCILYSIPAKDLANMEILYFNEDCTVPVLNDDMPFVFMNGIMVDSGESVESGVSYYAISASSGLIMSNDINMWVILGMNRSYTTEEAYEKIKELNLENNTPENGGEQ